MFSVTGGVIHKHTARTDDGMVAVVADIYGLKTKPVDISPYLTDLSLSELVQRSTQPPVQPLKAPEVKRPDNEIPFDQQISHLLPFLPPFSKQRRSSNSPSPATRVAAGEAASAKAAAAGDSAVQPKLGGKARPHRLMFDLESPGQAQESESLTRMVDPADAEQNTQGDRDSLALHVVSLSPSVLCLMDFFDVQPQFLGALEFHTLCGCGQVK